MSDYDRDIILKEWENKGYLSPEASKRLKRFKERIDNSINQSNQPPTILEVRKEIFSLRNSNKLTPEEETIIEKFEKMISGRRDADCLDSGLEVIFEKILEIKSSYFYKEE